MLWQTLFCLLVVVVVCFGRGEEEGREKQKNIVNDIVRENQKQGTPSYVWDISGAGDPSIQGFATKMSYVEGETVKLKIKTDATKYRVDFYRLGYYNGDGARLIDSVRPDESTLPFTQPECFFEKKTMLYDCSNWKTQVKWTLPKGVVSGVFVGRLVREDGGGIEKETWRVDGSKVGKDVRFGMDGEFTKPEAAPHAYGASGYGSLKNKIEEPSASHVYFVVRQKKRTSDILVQTSDTTWQAYNTYGGTSTYGSWNPANPLPRAYIASYNRPLITRDTRPINTVWTSEYPLLRWLEKNGYDVSYQSGGDTARLGVGGVRGEGGEGEGGHRVFVSSGHDEYWSGEQRKNIEEAKERGMHLMFLSGNEMFWKIRWEGMKSHEISTEFHGDEEENDESDHRLMVCYKESQEKQKIDPAKDIWTGTFRDSREINPEKTTPENSVTGTIFTVNAWRDDPLLVPFDYRALRFWRNTSIAELEEGETKILKQGLLGHEWDEDIDNGYRPPGLFHLSSTFVDNVLYIQDWGETYDSGAATHHLTMHKHKSGAIVFGAGTCQWSWGLDAVRQFGVIQHTMNFLNPRIGTDLSGTSIDVEQATANILADMEVLPLSLSPHLVLPTPSRDTEPPISVLSLSSSSFLSSSLPFVNLKIDSFDKDGCVAGVEVSLDNGHFYAARRFQHGFDEQRYGEGTKLACSPTWVVEMPYNFPSQNKEICVSVRAVDDSGNLEDSEKCSTLLFELLGDDEAKYSFL